MSWETSLIKEEFKLLASLFVISHAGNYMDTEMFEV